MIVLDASALVAFSKPSDQHHEAAVQEFGANLGNLAISSLTLAEFLVHPAQADRAASTYEDLTSPGGLAIQVIDAPLVNGRPWPVHLAHVRAETRLKMPDAVVLATALAVGGKVLTYDATLARAAKTLG